MEYRVFTCNLLSRLMIFCVMNRATVKTILGIAQDKENEKETNQTAHKDKKVPRDTYNSKKPTRKDITETRNTDITDLKKTTQKDNVTDSSVVRRGPMETIYWQNTDKLNAAEVHITNLFIKILHFKDEKYPLS